MYVHEERFKHINCVRDSNNNWIHAEDCSVEIVGTVSVYGLSQRWDEIPTYYKMSLGPIDPIDPIEPKRIQRRFNWKFWRKPVDDDINTQYLIVIAEDEDVLGPFPTVVAAVAALQMEDYPSKPATYAIVAIEFGGGRIQEAAFWGWEHQ